MCRAHSIPHAVRNISLSEVYRAEEVFCTGTMGELAPVVEIDGRKIGDGKAGLFTTRLSQLYRKLTATTGVDVVG